MVRQMNKEESDQAQHSQQWLEQLLEGRDDVVQQFWNQYGGRLGRLAGKQLNRNLERRVDADDVVQSACRTFFRRAGAGQFKLDESESLWRLLCAIVVNKAKMKIRFHLQGKRGVNQEEHLSDGEARQPQIGVSSEPAPEDVAEYNDQFEHLMQSLDQEEQQIIQLKLEDLTNDEIAGKLGCSERTVRRVFSRIRSRLIDQWESP